MTRPIRGMNPIPGFNGGPSIDLNVYQDRRLPTQINGTFSHIGSINLEEVDEDEGVWLNDAIRDDGNTLERIEDFENTFELKGFNTSYDPPIMGTDGKPRDGRGRVIGGKRRGEKYIPAFFYTYNDTTERCRVSNGVKENLKHDPAYKATREDIIKAALYLISEEQLDYDNVSIDAWLNEIQIEKTFNSRNIKIIFNDIIKRGKNGGEEAVRTRKDRKDWERWCIKNLSKRVNSQHSNKENTWLVCVDNDTYSFRVYAQSVLESIKRQAKANKNAVVKTPIRPAEFILYTNKKTHQDAVKCVKAFKKGLDQTIRDSYFMVGLDYNLPMTPQTPKYVILGAIPQLIGKHDVNGDQLVPIDNY